MTEDERFFQMFQTAPSEAKNAAITATGMFIAFVKRREGQPFDTQPTARRVETERPSYLSQKVVVQPAVAVRAPVESAEPVAVAPVERSAESSSASLGGLRRVNKYSPEQRAVIRRELVRRIYEPGLSRDLVDRIVDLQEDGVRAYEINAAIERAKEDAEVCKATEGAKGVRFAWMSLSAWAKNEYKNRGVDMPPCSKVFEPEPQKPKPRVEVYYRDVNGSACSVVTAKLSEDEAITLSDLLDEERLAPQEVNERIAEYAARVDKNNAA